MKNPSFSLLSDDDISLGFGPLHALLVGVRIVRLIIIKIHIIMHICLHIYLYCMYIYIYMSRMDTERWIVV